MYGLLSLFVGYDTTPHDYQLGSSPVHYAVDLEHNVVCYWYESSLGAPSLFCVQMDQRGNSK